jgi:hypothetical protein
VPAGLVIADPDVYLPDGFAGDRLGVLLAELLPLAAVVDAAEAATDMEVRVGV